MALRGSGSGSLRRLAHATCLVAVGLGTAASAEPRVEAFSPTGHNKDVRQAVAQFSEDMVKLGDPDLPSPFSIQCTTPGDGRWVDERTWVYDFEYDLPGAVKCRFRLRRGARSLAGHPVEGERRFAFNTGGPSVRDSLPKPRSTIDGRQVFLLGLDAPAQVPSISAHAQCQHDAGRQTSGVDVLRGDERQEILDLLDQHQRYRLNDLIEVVSTYLPPFVGEDRKRREALRRIALVRCHHTLAPGKAALVWDARIAGVGGQRSPNDQVLEFQVRPAFKAHAKCSWALNGCLPHALGVRFTAPIAREFVSLAPTERYSQQ